MSTPSVGRLNKRHAILTGAGGGIDLQAAIDVGAWAVVAGTGITHPTSITSWFKAAVEA